MNISEHNNPVRYQTILPTEALQKYVRNFCLIEGDVSSKTFKIIADGCPGLIFQNNANAFTNENKQHLPQLFLHGLTTSHSEKLVSGNFSNIAVHLKPTALKELFGLEAEDFTNTYFALDEIIKTNLAEQLSNAVSVEERIALLSGFLLKNIRRNQFYKTEKITTALDFLQRKHSIISLKEMQSSLNISERSLERLFNQSIGIAPKLFIRIAKFQRSVNDLRQNNFSKLTDIAYNHHYADQSHYIRDFKKFAGVTPNQFISRANEQVENFPEWN